MWIFIYVVFLALNQEDFVNALWSGSCRRSSWINSVQAPYRCRKNKQCSATRNDMLAIPIRSISRGETFLPPWPPSSMLTSTQPAVMQKTLFIFPLPVHSWPTRFNIEEGGRGGVPGRGATSLGALIYISNDVETLFIFPTPVGGLGCVFVFWFCSFSLSQS